MADPYAEGTVKPGTPADAFTEDKIPLPRPRPKKKKPALDTEGMARLSGKVAKKASGGMIDRAAIRGKTKGKIC